MIVAQLRGQTFTKNKGGYWTPYNNAHKYNPEVIKALEDCSTSCGFENRDQYLKALGTEENIIERFK